MAKAQNAFVTVNIDGEELRAAIESFEVKLTREQKEAIKNFSPLVQEEHAQSLMRDVDDRFFGPASEEETVFHDRDARDAIGFAAASVRAQAQGIVIDTYKHEMNDVDRAIAESDTEGFVKVHVRNGKDTIVGATIVASSAGEMINEITMAMVNRIGLGRIDNVIHPYRTQAEAIKRVSGAYNRTRLTPFVASLFRRIMAWQRKWPSLSVIPR